MGKEMLKGKQREGSIINIKLIQYTSVNLSLQEDQTFCQNQRMFEKIKNFDNAAGFLLLKAFFLQTIISYNL